jgi:hypothetical protein
MSAIRIANRLVVRCAGRATPLCRLCRRCADPVTDGDPPLAGHTETVHTIAGPQVRWICDQCTRKCLRAIEAGLDLGWWVR